MIIKIEKTPKFAIRLFNRNLLEVTHHKLMEVYADSLENIQDEKFSNIHICIIDNNNIESLENDSFQIKDLKYISNKNKDLSIGIMATIDGKPAGMCFGLLPKGQDNQYIVKYSDLYIHHVFVFPEFRGNRIVGYMIKQVYKNAKKHLDINRITLAVRENNEPAIKSYKRIGFKTYKNKSFITVGKWNIPQPRI